MKKITPVMLIIMALSLGASAQDNSSRKQEIGICLNAPHSFGIRYRIGSENTLLRFTLLSLNGGNGSNKYNSDQSSRNSNGAIGLNIGFEKRRSIAKNLSFFSGSDILMSYYRHVYKNPQTSYSNNDWTISSGIGLVLGFNYKINEDINISAEVVPSVEYSYSKSISRNGTSESVQIGKGLSYGFTSSVCSLTLSFSFGKKK